MSSIKYIDKKTPIFFVKSNDLEGRLDPYYYNSALKEFTENQKFQVKKINDIALSFTSGFGVGRQDQAKENEGVIQIRPTNLDKFGKLKFDKNVYIPKALIKSKSHLLTKGDVIFNNTNSQEWVGKTAYYDLEENYAFSNHITVIKVDNSIIEPKYLWLILNLYQRKKIFFSICTNWNNQSGVGLDVLKSLKIPVPNIDTQREIVALLENGFKLKHSKEAKARELLDSIDSFILKELNIELPNKDDSLKKRIFLTSLNNISGSRFDPFYNQTYFLKLLVNFHSSNLKIVPLKNLCYWVRGVTYSRSDEIQSNDGIAIIRANNITLDTNQINFDSVRYIRKDFNIQEEQRLIKNDILISAASGSKEHVGKVAFIEDNLESYFGGFMAVIRIKHNEIEPKYLFYFLQSKLFREILFRVLGGTNINNLNFSMISNYPVPLPSKEFQLNLISYLDSIRNDIITLIKNADRDIENARTLVEKMILNK